MRTPPSNRPSSPPLPTRCAACRWQSPTRRHSWRSGTSECISAGAAAATRMHGSTRRADVFVAGLVLAAGGSSRLGRPKQLLPYGSATLLDHVLDTARSCDFDQLVVALGGALGEVRARVDLAAADVAINPDFGEGCSSSIAAALEVVDARCEVLVLML